MTLGGGESVLKTMRTHAHLGAADKQRVDSLASERAATRATREELAGTTSQCLSTASAPCTT